MTSSIIINNQYPVTTSPSNPYSQDTQVNSVFSDVYGGQLATTETVGQTQFSNRITQINQADVVALYNELKQSVKDKIDLMNVEKKELTPSSYYHATIDEIMNVPIEVKIERDEVNQAIIYNRLGISYLDVKKLEVKMELLALAKEDVMQQKKKGVITEEQATRLVEKIEGFQEQLQEEKQNVLEGRLPKITEQLFFEQLTAQKNFNL